MKKAASSDAAFNFLVGGCLVHSHADLGFVDGAVEMFNRLCPVTVEIVLGDFQFVLGSPHMLQCFIDMRMSFRRRHRCRR